MREQDILIWLDREQNTLYLRNGSKKVCITDKKIISAVCERMELSETPMQLRLEQITDGSFRKFLERCFADNREIPKETYVLQESGTAPLAEKSKWKRLHNMNAAVERLRFYAKIEKQYSQSPYYFQKLCFKDEELYVVDNSPESGEERLFLTLLNGVLKRVSVNRHILCGATREEIYKNYLIPEYMNVSIRTEKWAEEKTGHGLNVKFYKADWMEYYVAVMEHQHCTVKCFGDSKKNILQCLERFYVTVSMQNDCTLPKQREITLVSDTADETVEMFQKGGYGKRLSEEMIHLTILNGTGISAYEVKTLS